MRQKDCPNHHRQKKQESERGEALEGTSTSKLSSRSPVVKYDSKVELRRFPATTVILPAKLHSDSCNSIFSSWDIDREEEREGRASLLRAPLAHFRRSYILSDCSGSQPPPVTLSIRQGIRLTLTM